MARLFEGNAGRADAVAAPIGDRTPRVTAPVRRLAVTDGSSLFTRVAALSWVGLALAPILISIHR